MGQIITLLSNLFSLTKVASVTLPGLLTAVGFALILWPSVPVDLIPVVTAVTQFEGPVAGNILQLRAPRVNASREPSNEPVRTFPPSSSHACSVDYWVMNEVPSQVESAWLTSKWAAANPGIGHCKTSNKIPPDEAWLSDAACQFEGIEKHAESESTTQRKRSVIEQFVLDFEARNLAVCIDLEKSWQGQEQKDILQLTSDLDILEKQRSAAQDSYLAYQKLNNGMLTGRYEDVMDEAKARIDTVRNTLQGRNRDVQDRILRVNELDKDQQIIADRLGDPGRLRPRVGLDLFLTGLINHIVGFILLSLAAAVVVTAFDRAAFGFLFEDLFDGF